MLNTLTTWLLNAFKFVWRWISTHRNAAFWMASITISIISIVILISVFGTSTAKPALGAGWLFLKMAFAGLIIVAYASKDRPYLAWTFTAIAVLIFLVLLGKLDGLLSWATLGFPILAAAGIWGSTKVEAGRMKAFLCFASSILILFWMFLLYLGHSEKISIGFLKIVFQDDTAKTIFVLFLAIFIFATWKRSKIFYAISMLIFLSFLGNAMVNSIWERYPKKLKVSLPNITGTSGKIVDGIVSSSLFVSARKGFQAQKTWTILVGTMVYRSEGEKDLVPMPELKYPKTIKVISQGSSMDINGAIYEKVSLPDLGTGQPGKIIGYVFSEDLKNSETTQPKTTEPSKETARTVPSPKLRLLYMTSAKDVHYDIVSLQRTRDKVSIQCTYELKFEGNEVGTGEYTGMWIQGNRGGSFKLSFSDPTSAKGTIRVDEGDMPIIIKPI